MRKIGNYESFTKRSGERGGESIPSEESRLTNEQLNYSFRKELEIPEFKQVMSGERGAREVEEMAQRVLRLEAMMSRIMHSCEINLQVTKNNQKRIANIQNNTQRILDILSGDRKEPFDLKDKENDCRGLNIDMSQPKLSTLYSKSHIDSRENTLTKKLTKTRSILSIQDRKKEIDKEISMRLRQESAKRKKILYDLRKQSSYTQKFF